MTAHKDDSKPAKKQSEGLDLHKRTLKDLAESGENVKGGVRKGTAPTACSSTAICETETWGPR